MNRLRLTLLLFAVTALVGCSRQQKPVSEQKESLTAKQMLQGVWIDEDTEAAVFRMKGDSVFYADSTSMPAKFKVVGDTLYIGDAARYAIVKHTEHVLWFRNQSGETRKFVKNTGDGDESVATEFNDKPTVLTLTEVLKRDTVVFHANQRYHIYVAINPTKYKVARHTVNEDGLDVENVYYDNIIHLSIFNGTDQIFSRDFRKQFFERKVPAQFLTQAILNDMQYGHTDAQGFHLNTSLCMPDEASCYLVETIVGFDGKLTTKLLEY